MISPGADGVMLGRASHGAPWIFRAVNTYLTTQELRLRRSRVRRCVILFSGISNSLYAFYGEDTGVRIARKHLGWYCEQLLTDPAIRPPRV